MADDALTVLVYSDDRNTRDEVRLALGRRPASDLPPSSSSTWRPSGP